MITRLLTVVGAASLLATAVAAQTPTGQPATPASKSKDPNRIICEKEAEIGSRLATKKVCKTWLQWQQEREEHRNSLEKVQQGTSISKSG